MGDPEPFFFAVAMDLRWKPNVTVAAIIEIMDASCWWKNRLRMVFGSTTAGHLDLGRLQPRPARETLEETAYAFSPISLVGIYMSRQIQANGTDTTYLRFAFCGTLGRSILIVLWTRGLSAPSG